MTFPHIPLPTHLHDSARIYWMMSEWCNYSCEYCGVPVFLKRSGARGTQNHAFDHYPVEEWLEGFRRFPQSEIAMVITGGEPFLDKKNFPALLRGLQADGRFSIRVYTNLSWNPADYESVDASQIHLNTTFHPSQTSFADYRCRLHKIRDAGFQFSHVGVILAPENLDAAESALTTLEDEGFPISGGTMLPAGRYMDRAERSARERDLIRRFSFPLSAYFSVTRPVTSGRACYHPAFSYRLYLDGTVNVACVGTGQNLFRDGVPALPRYAVACPNQHCDGCPEMIRAIVDLPQYGKPLSIFHPAEATQEIVDYRKSRKLGLSDKDQAIFEEIEQRLESVPEFPPARPPLPVSALTGGPAGPPFGYIDKIGGSDVIQALSRDRIYLSGWAASEKVGEPIEEVSLFVNEIKVASIRNFHPRPEVVEAFHRDDLLHSGWRAQFYLPILERGEYPIVARPVTTGGTAGSLPAFILQILE